MSGTRKIAKRGWVLVALHLIAASLFGLDFEYILSFEFAFFGFVIVALLSFMRARKVIFQGSGDELDSKKLGKTLALGFRVVFSLWRMVGYALFVAGLVTLLHFEVFSFFGFILGVLCALACILIILKGKL